MLPFSSLLLPFPIQGHKTIFSQLWLRLSTSIPSWGQVNALGRISYQDLCSSWLPQSHSLVPSAFYFSMCLGEHICSQKLFCALDWKISHKHHEINMAPTFSQWPYSIYLALSATALFDYLKPSAGMIQWLEAQDHLLTYSNLFPRSSSLFLVPNCR